MTHIPKRSIITTKTTGSLENLLRISASHKAPLLTLTGCLSLFSILLPRAPDAGLKLPGMWDGNSRCLLSGSQPKGSREGSCASRERWHWAGHWCQLCTEHQMKGAFLQACTPFLLQLELPDVHKATFTWDLCWLLCAPGRKAGRAGHEMSLKLQCPGIQLHPKHQDSCWSELVSPESGTTRDIPNQLQHAFSCGYSSFKSQLLFTETVYFSWDKVLSSPWQGKQRVLSSPRTYAPIERRFRIWKAYTYFSPQNGTWRICY